MAAGMGRQSSAAGRRLRRRTAAAASALVLVACFATTAAAGAAVPKPVLATIECELWPDRQQGLTSLTVLARLPEGGSLPATVDLPLPEGATITWSGEIDEADASGASDTSQTARILEVGGGRAARIVARKSRLVQYEAILGPSRHEGTRVAAALDWKQTVPTGNVTFSSRVPIDATQVKVTPPPVGDPQRNEQLGQMLYALAPASLKVGQLFVLHVEYELAAGGQAPQGPASSGKAASGPGGVPVWVFVLLAAAVAMLPVVIGVQRRRQAVAEAGASSEEPGEERDEESDDEEQRGDRK